MKDKKKSFKSKSSNIENNNSNQEQGEIYKELYYPSGYYEWRNAGVCNECHTAKIMNGLLSFSLIIL